jgi:hypothetical protein
MLSFICIVDFKGACSPLEELEAHLIIFGVPTAVAFYSSHKPDTDQ